MRCPPIPIFGTFLTSAQHLRGWDERRLAIAQAAEKAAHTCNLLARHCIDGPTVTRRRRGSDNGILGAYREAQAT